MEPARRGCVRTWRSAVASASGIVVVDDDARSATEELDGVRKGGGHDRPATRDGVDQDTGGDLIGGVVGQYDDRRGLDQGRQR